MKIADALAETKYVVDVNGNRTDVVIPLEEVYLLPFREGVKIDTIVFIAKIEWNDVGDIVVAQTKPTNLCPV